MSAFSYFLFSSNRGSHFLQRPSAISRAKCSLKSVPRACQNGLPRSSTALNQEDSSSRYIDLRTMQVIRADDAHLCDNANPASTFGIFDNPDIFNDPQQMEKLLQLLFTTDTIPLSDSEKQVVQNLLARRSVLYTATAGNEREAIVVDVVMRNRLWKERIVYCASSSRAAEAMYAVLCAQLGMERRGEILLDLGHGNAQLTEEGGDSLAGVRVIITLPHVLRSNIVTCDGGGWMSEVSIVFLDTFSIPTLLDWEEILLSMPSRILLCFFTKELCRSDQELLPLWIETIQNPLVSVSPPGATSLLDRIERPEGFPLLRTFVYNAAVHETPVPVSLTMLKNVYHHEIEQSDGNFAPKYSECFLHGITMLHAENASELMFRDVDEAEYADICSLIVADAKTAFVKAKSKRKRSKASKRKERTASSRAAARRRREAALSHSLLFPAIALVQGRKETLSVANAIESALDGNADLLWDDDTRDHLEDIVDSFTELHRDQLSINDREVLAALKLGVGVVNESVVPAVRNLVEELFRGGFIPLIVCDAHLGSRELNALPCAKSVLMQSSCMATCDDVRRGLITTSTAACLAGRSGKDDVGNLIFLWYDESVDDEMTGYEIASTMLNSAFAEEEYANNVKRRSRIWGGRGKRTCLTNRESMMLPPNGTHSPLSSSYDGVLRAVRRFGLDGYESIVEYSLSAFQGWLERAALRATLEKLSVERKAIDERLEEEDWSSIADHERREAKMSEVGRVLKAMESRYHTVRSRRLLNELRQSHPGRIVGVKCAKESDLGLLWEPKLLESTGSKREENSDGENTQEQAGENYDEKKHLLVPRERTRKTDPMSAAGFVTVLDQTVDGKRIKGLESRYLVVCILADGMWTMLPLGDVLALADEEEEVLHNVDLLMMPHPATFDADPSSGWAKCRPIDDMERDAVHRISDELIARVAGEDRPSLIVYKIPEYEAQKERMEMVQTLHRQSPWYGRDDEIVELQRLRRRSAKIRDEIGWLEKSESQLEDELFTKHNTHRSLQSSLMATLEDCHAVYVRGDNSMEMTPIGSLASVLPSDYPVFAAACFALIDDIEQLTPAELASFTALVACTGRTWKKESPEGEESPGSADEEPLDLSIIQRRSITYESESHQEVEEKDFSEQDEDRRFLPGHVKQAINEIQQALHQLHRRHLDESHAEYVGRISEIVPPILNTRIAEAIGEFANGSSWREVVMSFADDAHFAVQELKRVKSILSTVSRESATAEFSEKTRKLARLAFEALDRWPVQDGDTVLKLVEEGVVEKPWNGNTYDKWWRNVRDSLTEMIGASKKRKRPKVEGVEAEILESP